MSNGIATRQNEDNSIAMLAAQRQLYREAKKYNTVSVALSVWIPLALAVILLFLPENTEWRYASYILSIVSMFFSFVIDKYIEEISSITKNISKGAKLKKLVYKYRKPIFNAMKNKKIGNFLFNECLYESNYDLLELFFHKNKNE